MKDRILMVKVLLFNVVSGCLNHHDNKTHLVLTASLNDFNCNCLVKSVSDILPIYIILHGDNCSQLHNVTAGPLIGMTLTYCVSEIDLLLLSSTQTTVSRDLRQDDAIQAF